MNTALLIVAHTPLASALRDCVLHVFPEAASAVAAVDVLADDAPAVSEQRVRSALQHLRTPASPGADRCFGATPCNVAQKVVDGVHARLVAGVNLPMLLRTVNYRHGLWICWWLGLCREEHNASCKSPSRRRSTRNENRMTQSTRPSSISSACMPALQPNSPNWQVVFV